MAMERLVDVQADQLVIPMEARRCWMCEHGQATGQRWPWNIDCTLGHGQWTGPSDCKQFAVAEDVHVVSQGDRLYIGNRRETTVWEQTGDEWDWIRSMGHGVTDVAMLDQAAQRDLEGE